MDWIHARSAWWGIGLSNAIVAFLFVLYCASTGKKIATETNGVKTLLFSLCILLGVLLWRGWS